MLKISFALLGIVVVGAFSYLLNMPGRSFRQPLPPLSAEQAALRERLRQHVTVLAGEIGGRSVGRYDGLQAAARYLKEVLGRLGFPVAVQSYEVQGREVENIEVELKGQTHPDQIVIIGAHYDSAGGLPGANDNATGTAAVLELARAFAGRPCAQTLRFVLFVNEEPPYFQGSEMGSLVYARRCRERQENVTAMLSLETIGYYSDEPDSQRYPIRFHPGLPNTANFIGFVSNVSSARLLRRVVGQFRRTTQFPSEAAAAPGDIPGVGWSDHWSFWQQGYHAVMVTDTALYRYPYYHTAEDTPDKIDYDRFTYVVSGLREVTADLAGISPK